MQALLRWNIEILLQSLGSNVQKFGLECQRSKHLSIYLDIYLPICPSICPSLTQRCYMTTNNNHTPIPAPRSRSSPCGRFLNGGSLVQSCPSKSIHPNGQTNIFSFCDKGNCSFDAGPYALMHQQEYTTATYHIPRLHRSITNH